MCDSAGDLVVDRAQQIPGNKAGKKGVEKTDDAAGERYRITRKVLAEEAEMRSWIRASPENKPVGGEEQQAAAEQTKYYPRQGSIHPDHYTLDDAFFGNHFLIQG